MLFFPETYQLRLGIKPNVQVSPLPLISEFDFRDRREQSWNKNLHSTLNQNSYWENFINTRRETCAVWLYRKWWKLGQSPTCDDLQEQSKPVLTVDRHNSVQLLVAVPWWQVSRKRCAEHYLTNDSIFPAKNSTNLTGVPESVAVSSIQLHKILFTYRLCLPRTYSYLWNYIYDKARQ